MKKPTWYDTETEAQANTRISARQIMRKKSARENFEDLARSIDEYSIIVIDDDAQDLLMAETRGTLHAFRHTLENLYDKIISAPKMEAKEKTYTIDEISELYAEWFGLTPENGRKIFFDVWLAERENSGKGSAK